MINGDRLLASPKGPIALLLPYNDPRPLVDMLFKEMRDIRKRRQSERAPIIRSITSICKNLNQLGYLVIIESKGGLVGASLKVEIMRHRIELIKTPSVIEQRLLDMRRDIQFIAKAKKVGVDKVEQLLLERLRILRGSDSNDKKGEV